MYEPKLRFTADDGSKFPDWEEKKLGEVATRVTRKNKDNITNIPLTISSVDGLIDQRDFFNKVVASKDMSGYYLLNNGEFAYNKSYSKGYDFGSIKRLDLYDCGALSTLYICFALDGKENSDFYQKYFDSLLWYSELQKICAEGARNHGLLNVPTNDFFQLKLCVPSSKDEQKKIADFLSIIDAVIEKQKEIVEVWEERKKGVMQKLFSKNVRFRADDGSEFPDWKEKKMGDVCNTFSGGTPKSGEGRYYENGTINFIRSGDIHGSNTELSITEDGLNESSAKLVVIGDILYALYGATSGEVDISKINGAINQAILCIRPIDGYDRKFIVEILRYNKENILRKYLQGGQGNLSAQIIQGLHFEFPCLVEQQKIADCLSSLDDVIKKQKVTLATWEEMKRGLLQQMFV